MNYIKIIPFIPIIGFIIVAIKENNYYLENNKLFYPSIIIQSLSFICLNILLIRYVIKIIL